jgi:hypothetical protein
MNYLHANRLHMPRLACVPILMPPNLGPHVPSCAWELQFV